jgi:phosphoribosylformylglycinamidine synthase subunit PurQ / glutaminase
MSTVKALVLTGYGLNCDNETAYSLELAGAQAHRAHINTLIDGDVKLDDFQLLVFGGGFAWADDHGAGVIQAVRFKHNIGESLLDFIKQGNLVIGICNGFQTLVNLGLLPGFDNDYQTRSVALTYNDCGNFRDDWVHLKVNAKSPCVFTKDLDFFDLPVRHGEGKLCATDDIIKRLITNNQVVMHYTLANGDAANLAFPENPNGSIHDIAGICDPTGRVFGLMPHPEAFNHYTNHPAWTFKKSAAKRQGKDLMNEITPGIRLFKNAVDYIRSSS